MLIIIWAIILEGKPSTIITTNTFKTHDNNRVSSCEITTTTITTPAHVCGYFIFCLWGEIFVALNCYACI